MKETKQLKAKDKLFLVVYLSVGTMSEERTKTAICAIKHDIENMVDDSVVVLVFPVHGIPTHVELLNSKYSNKTLSNKVEKLLNEFDKKDE